MKDFMIIAKVNGVEYLTKVSAESEGGAEHKILDDVYYGVETCQAFSMQELGTEIFASLSANCETISFAEMQHRASCYKCNLEMIDEKKAKIAELKKAVGRYEYEIKIAKENIKNFEVEQATHEHNIKNIW